jgi:hypothetical protein
VILFVIIANPEELKHAQELVLTVVLFWMKLRNKIISKQDNADQDAIQDGEDGYGG